MDIHKFVYVTVDLKKIFFYGFYFIWFLEVLGTVECNLFCKCALSGCSYVLSEVKREKKSKLFFMEQGPGICGIYIKHTLYSDLCAPSIPLCMM